MKRRPASGGLPVPAWGIRLAWLLLALVASGYCGWRFTHTSPLQTDLLALLPATEVDPLAEQAVDRLAASFGDRAVFLVSGPDAHARAAARQLGAMLGASGAFRTVTAQLPPFDLSSIGALYRPYRFNLLTPADRSALSHDDLPALRAALMQRLYSPLQGGLAVGLADDPFGWLEHWLAALPVASSNLRVEDNLLVVHRGAQTGVLVVATLPGSAYETKVQRAVQGAFALAGAKLARQWPDVTLARTGAVFYAEAARRSSEREVHRIGLISVCGIALLMLWVFRSPRLLLLGFVSTLLGIVCALAATLLVFGKLHLLTLVFGASLLGEAVDYSVQYFVARLDACVRATADTPAAVTARDPWHQAREVRGALSVALATSLIGYAVLFGVPFPVLRQIACFAMVGICIAFASVLTLLPALLGTAAPIRPRRLFERSGRLLAHWRGWLAGPRAWGLVALVLLAAVPGWLRLTSDDDVRLLIQRDPVLQGEERIIQTAVGLGNSSAFYLVRGASEEQVLERAERLGARLDALRGPQASGGARSVTDFVPSAQRQAADRSLLASKVFADPAALRALLRDAGFRDEVIDGWLAAWARSGSARLDVETWLAAPWSQPFRYLWFGGPAGAAQGYAAVVMPHSVNAANRAALSALAAAVPGVSFVDKAYSVSRLFGAYRIDSGWWLAGVLVLVMVLLTWRYGLRGGLATVLPVLLAIGATLALFGYARVPLNLFNWLAMMLVLGVGANYAVFLREGCLRRDADLGAVWAGVLLSAATTMLSFGLLAGSAMPALRSFGMTLSLGVAIAVLLAPLGLPAAAQTAGGARA